MKIYTGCIPCFARQAVEAAEMATEDPALREKIIQTSLRKISELPFEKTPPHMMMEFHRIIRDLVGDIGPYRGLKSLYNRKALEYYPSMKKIVSRSRNHLETAVRLAIAGNNIDFGIRANNDIIHIQEIIDEMLTMPFGLTSFFQG